MKPNRMEWEMIDAYSTNADSGANLCGITCGYRVPVNECIPVIDNRQKNMQTSVLWIKVPKLPKPTFRESS